MELNNEEFVIGTCPTMCPIAEMRFRERHNLLHKFEMVKGTETFRRPRVDTKKAVKQYSRPAAGKQDPATSDLRPPNVLLKTTHYLIESICGMDNANWVLVYEFVFDRLRAIRQDMVMQNLHCREIVTLLECCVRFHIYSSYKLRGSDPGDYDEKINTTHTQECLKRLLCLYDVEENCKCNQGEFLALYLLFNIGSTEAIQFALEHKYDINQQSGFAVQYDIKQESDFQLALSISLAWLNFNYVRLFKLTQKLSPLHFCALQMHFPTIQRKALSVMSAGFNNKTLGYSLSDLTRLLSMDNEGLCQTFCEQHGLQLKDEVTVIFNKATFHSVDNIPRSSCKALDNKLDKTIVSKLLNGRSCQCYSSDH